MRFYFPDSQDQIDPRFDFANEERSPLRVRQRDDRYAHEVLDPSPYQGLLVSKAMIDAYGGAGRYSAQQRQRFFRVGVREFFRLETSSSQIETLGDCGAFSYISEDRPPYSADEVIDFYEAAGFDAGVSIDHVIPVYKTDEQLELMESPWKDRYEVTLGLAEEFLSRHRERGCCFEPIGVAQGWSPDSYAGAVTRLQEMGYERVALGGLVPLKTPDVLAVMERVAEVRAPGLQMHLFGITRCDRIADFARYGATSFDSTSPFRQAFKDDCDNYYWEEGSFVALRVPQVEGNAKLGARIRSGQVDQGEALTLERTALDALAGYERREVELDVAVTALREYEKLHDGRKDRSDVYRETLAARPWESCDCAICRDVGIQVVVFRGTERNRRRGFHNLHVFSGRLEGALGCRRKTPERSIAA